MKTAFLRVRGVPTEPGSTRNGFSEPPPRGDRNRRPLRREFAFPHRRCAAECFGGGVLCRLILHPFGWLTVRLRHQTLRVAVPKGQSAPRNKPGNKLLYHIFSMR